MDPERSHGSSMSDFFICFTSVPSSVNRKLMMRNNSSLKTGGQASSIFFNGRKKGSSGLENPEPSSPKVTCIGQVRIKSKKQSKKIRACRSIGRDEVTSSSSKKWVHFPLTVCEALRSFGAEYFKCFLPCTRSSSMAANLSEKDEKTEVRSGGEDDDDDDETIKEETLTQVPFENVPQKEAIVGEEGIEVETITQERSELECPEAMETDPEDESKEGGSQQNVLPECLLLMMCEPKLSMEVSKETWVCKRDFIREEKERQPLVKQMDGGDEPERRTLVDCDPALVSLQPPSSSCPLPASPPPITVANEGDATGSGGPTTPMVDQKPLVLKRCMSEPMRSSAKLFPSMVKI